MDTDRNLLFGVLALQADFITSAQFVECCTIWGGRKETPLAELLQERGWISLDDRADVDRLVDRKLRRHGGDVSASLKAATKDQAIYQTLERLNVPEIQTSLAGKQHDEAQVPLPTILYTPQSRERYTLTRLHAKGGIGQVWLARDAAMGRDVALKELRPEQAENPAVWTRFLEEARVTGQLEHPGIVPVYEVSQRSTEEGMFYTMRFVKGRTLHEAVLAFHEKRVARQATALDLRGLLEAFLAVCNSIAYAHSRGVIHRDLKGQNIVIGDFGEVIVLDWGLAKVVGRPEPEGGLDSRIHPASNDRAATLQGQAIGTPAYMAPEQAEGDLERIDHRTDVYGLGAILFEILTGQPPFLGSNSVEILRRVREDAPPKPRGLNPDCAPALEAISLKALSKQPAERYPSALALADDVRHWLADEPVSVHRDPIAQRLGRWSRRHRSFVTGVAGLCAAAMVGLTIGAVLLRAANARTSEALAKAESSFHLARQAIDRNTELVRDANELKGAPGLENLRRQLLETARDFYKTFAEQRSDDVHTISELAEAHLRLANLQGELGERRKAVSESEQAVNIFEKLAASSHPGHDYPGDLARAITQLGLFQAEIADFAAAERTHQRALKMQTARSIENPNDPDIRSHLAGIHNNLGQIYRDKGELDKAETQFKRSVELEEPLVKAHPSNANYREFLANHVSNLGFLCLSRQEPDTAIAHLRRAAELHEQLSRESPTSIERQQGLASAFVNLGVALKMASMLDGARKEFQKAADVLGLLAKDHPDRSEILFGWAATLHNLASTEEDLGHGEASEKLYIQALKINEGLVRAHPEGVDYADHLAKNLNNLGNWYRDQKRDQEAASFFRRAVDIRQAIVRDHPELIANRISLIRLLNNLGLNEQESNHLDAAEATLDQARTIIDTLSDQERKRTDALEVLAGYWNKRGALLMVQQRFEKAIEAWNESIKISIAYNRAFPDEPSVQRELIRAFDQRARAQIARQLPDEAINGLESISSILKPEQTQQLTWLRLTIKTQRGMHDASVSEATNWIDTHRPDQDDLINAAFIAALAYRAVYFDFHNRREERQRLALKYANQAIAWLRRAACLPNTDPRQLLERIRSSPPFLSLGDMSEFQLLVMDLAFPGDPFAR